MFKYLLSIFLVLHLSIVDAASVPAYTGSMNNAIGSIISTKLTKTTPTFAANDPNFTTTMSKVSSTLTTAGVGVAASLGLAAISSVTWPELIVGAAVATVVGRTVNLGIDNLVQWIWPSSSTSQQVSLNGSGMSTPNIHNLAVMPTSSSIFDTYGGGADLWFASDSTYTKYLHLKTLSVTCPSVSFACTSSTSSTSLQSAIDSTFSTPYSGPFPGANGYWSNISSRILSQTAATSGQPAKVNYLVLYQNVPASGVVLAPVTYISHPESVSQAVNDLPETQKSVALSDDQLASVVNAVWQLASNNASSPLAFPYSAANAITAADVAAWRVQNQNLVPTVGDFVSPIAAPGSNTVPAPNPATDLSASPNAPGTTPVQTTTTIDWGTFTPPVLESTPTTESILDPIFNMWPQWANYSFPAHNSQCPTPSFVALHQTFTFTQMCTWAETIRAPVQAVFSLCWALMVIFIVMGA